MMKITSHFYPTWITSMRPLVALVLLQFAVISMAAEPSEAGDTMQAEVKVVNVAPVQRVAALLAPNAQTPLPPVLLDSAQRERILVAAVLDRQAEDAPAAAGAAETRVLSAATPVLEGKGVLTLVQPFTVHPETGIHMRGSDPGSIGVKIMVEQGNHYLVDFVVRSAVPGTFRLEAEGESQEIADSEGSLGHVLLALSAQSTGWTTVRLRRPESDFFLYSVEITEFD